MIAELDMLPVMDYEDFLGFHDWNRRPMEFAQVMASRGCVGRCSFCTVYQVWGAQRFYSPEYVIHQIRHLADLYPYENPTVAFMDDNFLVNLDRMKKLIGVFKDNFKDYKWQIVDMRVDAISKDFFDFIKSMDCEFVGFGVESVHCASLDFLNKTADAQAYKNKVFKILDLAEGMRIRTMLSSILGTPHETRADMIMQADFFIEVFNNYRYANFDVAPLVIHPRTDLWHAYKSKQIEVYKRPAHSPKRFYEGMFADKWDHLIEFVPNAYRVANTKMPRDEFEGLLNDLIKNRLNPLTRAARQRLDNERADVVQ